MTVFISNCELTHEMTKKATRGFTWYNLQAPAKNIYPVVTPLRKDIPTHYIRCIQSNIEETK